MSLKKSHTELVQNLLVSHSGIALGDLHDTPAVHDAILELIPTLAASGVTRLYVEMLPTEANSLLVDMAHSAEARTAVRDWVYQRVGSYVPDPTDKYMQIIDSAQKHGIQVNAMDTEIADSSHVVGKRNEFWVKHIRKENKTLEEGTKYAVMAGAMHIDNFNRFSTIEMGDEATGIDKILGIPSITFETHPNLSAADRIVLKGSEGIMSGDYRIIIPEKLHPLSTPSPSVGASR